MLAWAALDGQTCDSLVDGPRMKVSEMTQKDTPGALMALKVAFDMLDKFGHSP